MKKIIIVLSFLLTISGQVLAEKRYVTDRILLGIHTESDETSAIIKSVPSGTELEVINAVDGFFEVKLGDGTTGWVSSGFIMESVPATRKYDVLAHQYEETTQELDKLKKDVEKKDRELQVRRDQLSNANTTIKELSKRNGSSSDSSVVADPEVAKNLEAALEEVEKLKLKITELEQQSKSDVTFDQSKIVDELKDVKSKNELMQTRIDVALAHLKGERIPSKEELESIRPKFPAWYWGLLAIILLMGVIAGYFIMDYRFRSRHGGFRF